MLIDRLNMLVRSQRGVALPMALLTMLILSALIIAFSMMSASEPVLANNQLQVAQARAVAESGVEQAIWALNNPPPANANGIPASLTPLPAAYDGTTTTPVTINGAQVGVFTVSVTNGGPRCLAASERCVDATGWTPTNTGTGPKVKQRIQVTVFQPRFLDPPSALTVRGEISVEGNSSIDSRSDLSCGNKTGTTSKGSTDTSGNARVYAADGNDVKNQRGLLGDTPLPDIIENVPDAAFNAYTYSNAELDALKALATRNGTYYQGTVAFNSSYTLPNGIIYVDTVSGQNIDENGANTTPTSDFASVNIDGNAALDATGIFSGMLIVAGSLSIGGSFNMHGTVYALDDFSYLGTTTGQIRGAVLSQNVRDVSATTIDTNMGGDSAIVWSCVWAKNGGGQLSQTFTIKTGTYKEISG